MDITQLSEASGVSVRNIKRFIELGLVDPPVGKTRGARYTARHLADLEKVKQAQAKGFTVGKLASVLDKKAQEGRLRPSSQLSFLIFPIGGHMHLLIDQDHTKLAKEVQQAVVKEMRQTYRRVVSK